MSANSSDINAPNSAAHSLQSTAVFNTYSNTSTVNTDQSRYTVELHDQLFALLLDALSETHMHVSQMLLCIAKCFFRHSHNIVDICWLISLLFTALCISCEENPPKQSEYLWPKFAVVFTNTWQPVRGSRP